MIRYGTRSRLALALVALGVLSACADDDASPVAPETPEDTVALVPAVLPSLGLGAVPGRFTSEVAVRGEWAYTGTWGGGTGSRARGNVLYVWNVGGGAPALRDSVVVPNAGTLSDVQVIDDLLVVSTEGGPGSIVVYGLANPASPSQRSRFSSANTVPGVHTVKLWRRQDGRLFAFLSVDPSPSGLAIVDLTNPASPQEVFFQAMGRPFIHDVFVRDGYLFTALWNDYTVMWDIGGGGQGSVTAPRRMATLRTERGLAHNVYRSARGSQVIRDRYVFVGEEGPGGVSGTTSSGDVHVVDISDPNAPREVAFLHIPGAGTHNFAVDEQSGILYAAYYNGGVKALNVRGDLGACADALKDALGRCDLFRMGRLAGEALTAAGRPVFVWGVAWANGRLYASDMLNGLWTVDAGALRR